MLSHHLEGALNDLRDLVKITESDISDIKEANSEAQFERISLKEEKLQAFESKKVMIDHEISLLIGSFPDKKLPELLNEDQHKALDDMKTELANLREVNKRYAKFVLSVSNIYNTFLEKIVPTEMNGYKRVPSQNPSILEVRI